MSKQSNETITQKLARLDDMVAWFESDEFVLEEAMERFEVAKKLADEIDESLATLKNEIVVLKQKFDEE